ncbi:transposase [Fervidobacterium islandicum]|uniref:Transposase n=1 Tax=Fervidobacterium islandicum TaxID=2423 RepID=A0AAJ5I560_FERIS|nr:transposase [Fervidobacterium islandicum]
MVFDKGIRKTRWSTYDLNYHFVWITKYRKPFLLNEIKTELERIIYSTAKNHEITVLSLCPARPRTFVRLCSSKTLSCIHY